MNSKRMRMLVLSILVLFSGATLYAAAGNKDHSDKSIDSFEECVEAGYHTDVHSEPPVCVTNRGDTFFKNKKSEE